MYQCVLASDDFQGLDRYSVAPRISHASDSDGRVFGSGPRAWSEAPKLRRAPRAGGRGWRRPAAPRSPSRGARPRRGPARLPPPPMAKDCTVGDSAMWPEDKKAPPAESSDPRPRVPSLSNTCPAARCKERSCPGLAPERHRFCSSSVRSRGVSAFYHARGGIPPLFEPYWRCR